MWVMHSKCSAVARCPTHSYGFALSHIHMAFQLLVLSLSVCLSLGVCLIGIQGCVATCLCAGQDTSMFGFVYLLKCSSFSFVRQQPAAVSLLMLLCVRNSSPLLEVDVLARHYELTPPPDFQGQNVRITNGKRKLWSKQVHKLVVWLLSISIFFGERVLFLIQN